MLLVGADIVINADFSLEEDGEILDHNSFRRRLVRFVKLPWGRVKKAVKNVYLLLKEDLGNSIYLPIGTLLSILNLFVIMLGGLISVFNRDYLFKKITVHELMHIA